jgi:hypothetical protein
MNKFSQRNQDVDELCGEWIKHAGRRKYFFKYYSTQYVELPDFHKY